MSAYEITVAIFLFACTLTIAAVRVVFAVIDVSDRADVHMRFGPGEFFPAICVVPIDISSLCPFCMGQSISLFFVAPFFANPRYRASCEMPNLGKIIKPRSAYASIEQ